MSDCLFCKIISGEIPSAKVYEDDLCYAFDDIEPEAPIHTLIVPKQHFDNLQDNVPAEVLGHLLSVVPKVAEIKGVNESGFRCVINTGPDSAATVGHLHIHVMGGIQWAAQLSRNLSAWKKINNLCQNLNNRIPFEQCLKVYGFSFIF